jgi:hypothetical protein
MKPTFEEPGPPTAAISYSIGSNELSQTLRAKGGIRVLVGDGGDNPHCRLQWKTLEFLF